MLKSLKQFFCRHKNASYAGFDARGVLVICARCGKEFHGMTSAAVGKQDWIAESQQSSSGGPAIEFYHGSSSPQDWASSSSGCGCNQCKETEVIIARKDQERKAREKRESTEEEERRRIQDTLTQSATNNLNNL